MVFLPLTGVSCSKTHGLIWNGEQKMMSSLGHFVNSNDMTTLQDHDLGIDPEQISHNYFSLKSCRMEICRPLAIMDSLNKCHVALVGTPHLRLDAIHPLLFMLGPLVSQRRVTSQHSITDSSNSETITLL